ncbi:MAG: CBS domain-containing protein [Rhodothalassiaceae bacterium]
MTVAHILREKGGEVATIEPDASVGEAVRRLAERGIGALLVCDRGGRICGVLSERDIVRALADESAPVSERPVSDLMTADVVTVRPEDDIASVMALMTERRIRHLPVLDARGRLVGLISIGDVVKRRIADAEHEAEALKDYIRMA